MKQLPLFLAFFLAGCQTLTIGMNPAPDARGFLDSLKDQDVAALDASVTDSASKENTRPCAIDQPQSPQGAVNGCQNLSHKMKYNPSK